MIIYKNHLTRHDNISSEYALFLDDIRMPKDVTWVELPMYNWVIVRTYDEFVDCITKYGIPKLGISWDHDLADFHMKDYFKVCADGDKIIDPLKLNYKTYTEKTGYHCAIFLSEYCIQNKYNIPEYWCHSMNHYGKANIISVLESAKKIIDNP